MPEEIRPSAPLPSAGDGMPTGGMAAATGPQGLGAETSELDDVPELMCAAGEPAVTVYLIFLNQRDWSRVTRTLYRQQAGRFFRWADGRGLALASIGPADVAAYAAEFGATVSRIRRLPT